MSNQSIATQFFPLKDPILVILNFSETGRAPMIAECQFVSMKNHLNKIFLLSLVALLFNFQYAQSQNLQLNFRNYSLKRFF